MRNIGVPRQISTLRPSKRVPVAVGRRNAALEQFIMSWTVPLPVYQPVPLELQRSLGVLAGGVLAVLGVAGRVGFGGVGFGNVDAEVRVMVGVEI